MLAIMLQLLCLYRLTMKRSGSTAQAREEARGWKLPQDEPSSSEYQVPTTACCPVVPDGGDTPIATDEW